MASRAEVLSVVERSPAAVAVHDRSAWLAIFSEDAVVEDPVGSAPAPKRDGTLGRFYDAFIAPHGIRFEIRRDHFLGDDVFRDAVIHTSVRKGVNVEVPAYLLYQVAERDGKLAARRMAAHWQLSRMVGLALRMGPRAWWAMTWLFVGMLRHLGLSWVAAYLASLWRTVGRGGLETLAALRQAVEARDAVALAALFEPGASIEFGARTVTVGALLDALPNGSALAVEAPVVAGWTVSFRFSLKGAQPAEGLALLEFSPTSRRVTRARFFPPA
ncbi:MAG: nuclear transport factor 2 family protein [Myxococcota bacterium]